ncbi:MAG: GIY-YIG nuclease family protein [Turicibacter sp.]|nr:GIY-YIG nuclease family protein [Turicibacter sp.]
MGLLSSIFSFLSSAAEEQMDEGIYEPGRPKEYGYDDVGQIPRVPGTYRILKDGQIMYIGVSKQLRTRIYQHRYEGEYRKFYPGEKVAIKIAKLNGKSYEEVQEIIYEHERKKVGSHLPPRNKNRGGGGPRIGKDDDGD